MSKLPNFSLFQIFHLSYVYAKYYSNLFAVEKVIIKIKKAELFYETQCTCKNQTTRASESTASPD